MYVQLLTGYKSCDIFKLARKCMFKAKWGFSMRTDMIIDKINNEFADTYKNASKFVDSGELWNFCIETIRNPITLGNIVFANDLGIE